MTGIPPLDLHSPSTEGRPSKSSSSFFYGLGLLALAAAGLLYGAFSLNRISPWVSAPLWILSAALTLTIVQSLFRGLRRKRETGSFLASAAEIATRRAKKSAATGKHLGPRLLFWIAPLLLLGTFTYYGILAAVIAIRECPCSTRLAVLLWGLSAALLVAPGLFVFKILRRKFTTGRFMAGAAELARVRARAAKPRSMRSTAITSGAWTLLAIMETYIHWRLYIRHPHQGSTQWVFAGAFWLVAGLNWLIALPIFRRTFGPAQPPEQRI